MSTTMTFGIDLAAQPKNTAGCLIEWDARGRGRVRGLIEQLADRDLLAWMTDSDRITRVAIDAPFGWPEPFVRWIPAYQREGRWPDPPGSSAHQDLMRLRATDRAVREVTAASAPRAAGLTPLSVSTDRIGVVAMRCARLLVAAQDELGAPIDRSGEGRFLEVYPAASLRQWGLSTSESDDPGSYKGRDPRARVRREWIVEALGAKTDGWLELGSATRAACVDTDHCLDALIASLTARAAERDLLSEVSDIETARVEGWIRLSRQGSLASFRATRP